MLPTEQCYRKDNVIDGTILPTGNRRTKTDNVTEILCSQQEKVTNRTMLQTGQCYRQNNATNGTMLPTRHRHNTKGQSD